MEYQPDFIIYEVQFRQAHGDWVCQLATEHDLTYALAYARKTARKSLIPHRVVRNDLRGLTYMEAAVVWVSHPTFPGHADYWRASW